MAEHRIDIDCPILTPEDGLLLGNGDLSVSIYQAVDEIRFRFGKGDVWDRRIDFSEDPKPAHINEVTEGILVEGWKCGPYGGPVEATKNAKNEKRMREICQGVPPSYEKRPFPCPKPVGELALHYSGDLQGLRIRQTLFIERSLVEIVCSWSNGVELWLNCFVASRDNTLLINWLLNGWSAESKYGGEFIGLPPVLPVWFSLYRWCDPRVGAFAADHIGSCRHPAFTIFPDEKIDPLPAPEIVALNGRHGIRQRFGSDAVFPAGFEYSITAQSDRAHIGPVARFDHAEARLHILPEQTSSSGTLAVAVATSSETTDTLSRAIESSDIDAADAHKWTLRDSSEFWSRSSIELADKQIEGLWYATLHAKRCVYRADRLPPGLFLPSTVHDYSFWHGDWHTNYNLQSMFLGDYACNHPELGDSYFRAMEYFLPIGRKIARDYYGCRGAFIQLSGFPTHPADDPLGCVPMGRMAYMTGWIANHYFERWRLTADRDWLGEEGYPAVREFALFYSDFLKKGNDELYHAFPSNQGEDGFSGSAADFTDRPQVMRHAGYCLHAAIEMSAAMNKDESLRAEWCAILKGLAVDESYARLS
ncbi:MAG TPA: hypothetical protein VG722_10705, partial [Tepidisphaeraceae bacterium]|nr:hypothetical protein [Tepidisphaeraceae bacterium]